MGKNSKKRRENKQESKPAPTTSLEPQQSERPSAGMWLHFVRVLLVSAMLITGYLSLVSLSQDSGVPGCGPESSCDQVLSSQWASWLGVPITLPGLVLYGVFLLNTFFINSKTLDKAKRTLNLQVLCSFAILAAALWFVGVQAVVIKAFCPYCCTAHALASAAAILFLMQGNSLGARLSVRLNFAGAGIAALVFVGIVAGAQVLFPKKQAGPIIVSMEEKNSNVEQIEPSIPEASTPPQEPSPIEPTQDPEIEPVDEPAVEVAPPVDVQPAPKVAIRIPPLPLPNSTIQFNPVRLPTLGAPDAPHRMGLMFDYTCHHCRNVHGFVRQLLKKYDGKLSCMLIPVPLDANCNPFVKTTQRDHIDACKYAKICLAVQLLAPEKYDAFDQWLFTDHEKVKTVDAVRTHAENLVGKDVLAKTVESAEVAAQLKQDFDAYQVNYRNSGKGLLPQTIINTHVIFGPPPDVETLDKIMKQLLGI
jgi:uncharacterized membrane protein